MSYRELGIYFSLTTVTEEPMRGYSRSLRHLPQNSSTNSDVGPPGRQRGGPPLAPPTVRCSREFSSPVSPSLRVRKKIMTFSLVVAVCDLYNRVLVIVFSVSIRYMY